MACSFKERETLEFTFAPDEPYRFVRGNLVSFSGSEKISQRLANPPTVPPTYVDRYAIKKHYGVILSGPHFDSVNVWPGEFDLGEDPESLGYQDVIIKWKCFDYFLCKESDVCDFMVDKEE